MEYSEHSATTCNIHAVIHIQYSYTNGWHYHASSWPAHHCFLSKALLSIPILSRSHTTWTPIDANLGFSIFPKDTSILAMESEDQTFWLVDYLLYLLSYRPCFATNNPCNYPKVVYLVAQRKKICCKVFTNCFCDRYSVTPLYYSVKIHS